MTAFLVSYRPVHVVSVHKMQGPGAEPIYWPICTCKWNDAATNAPAVTYTDERQAEIRASHHIHDVWDSDIGFLVLRREYG